MVEVFAAARRLGENWTDWTGLALLLLPTLPIAKKHLLHPARLNGPPSKKLLSAHNLEKKLGPHPPKSQDSDHVNRAVLGLYRTKDWT